MKKRQGRRHQNRMASSIYLLCSYPFALVKKREKETRVLKVVGSCPPLGAIRRCPVISQQSCSACEVSRSYVLSALLTS